MLINLIFPKKCISCGRNGNYICANCMSKQKQVKPICPFCFRSSVNGVVHRRCGQNIYLGRLTTIWEYSGVIKRAISSIKYKYAEKIAYEIVKYSLPLIKKAFKYRNNIVLIPIPLHARKRRFRGFNQCETIGKLISQKMKWKYIPNLLIKQKYSIPQIQLSGQQRVENIRGVFAFNRKYSNIESKYLLVIFDDVWTTGSTMREAAREIRNNLKNQVWGLTIAR